MIRHSRKHTPKPTPTCGLTLREIFDHDGRTRVDIAAAAHMSGYALERLQEGKVSRPQGSTFACLAAALGVAQAKLWGAWRLSRIHRLAQHPEEANRWDEQSGVVAALQAPDSLSEAAEARQMSVDDSDGL